MTLVERLRDPCIDWSGEAIVNDSTPRFEVHCGLLREAADRIEAMEAALREIASWDSGLKSDFSKSQKLAEIARAALKAGE